MFLSAFFLAFFSCISLYLSGCLSTILCVYASGGEIVPSSETETGASGSGSGEGAGRVREDRRKGGYKKLSLTDRLRIDSPID